MHELDELLQHSGVKDEKLLHYGVRGMKWKNRKEPEEIEEDESAGGEEVPDLGEFMLEEFGKDIKKKIKDLGSKMSKLDDKLKKSGVKALQKIFGKSKGPKYTVISSNPKIANKQLKGTGWKVSQPFNKDGTPKKKSNVKRTSSSHMTRITGPSREEIRTVAKMQADKWKRENRR